MFYTLCHKCRRTDLPAPSVIFSPQAHLYSQRFFKVIDISRYYHDNYPSGSPSPVEDDFWQCLESIFWLVDYSPSLGLSVIDSPRLLTMLMTESELFSIEWECLVSV